MSTIITARVEDQSLLLLSAPKIASGGKNEVRVEVLFDDSWNGFGKTAVFRRNKTTVYHVVMTDDTCTIPHEVLAEAGRLYFGIMGVSGSVTHTTEEVALAVSQGAATGVQPVEPTPDVYRQLVSAHGKNEQAIAAEKARIDNLVTGGTAPGDEVVDIRVGANGKTYGSAGSAVRGQIEELRLWSARQVAERISQIGAPSVNLFDYKNATFTDKGVIYSHSSTDINTPVKVTNTSAYSTIFDARPGVTYTVTYAFNYIVYFDKDGNKISYNSEQIGSDTPSYTFTTPAGCWYVGLAFSDDYIQPSEIMVVEGDTLPETYAPYAIALRGDVHIGGVVHLSPGESIQGAVDSGARIVYLTPGEYGAQTVDIKGRDELKLCVENAYKGERVTKPNVVIDNSVPLATAASDGLAIADATFATTSNWYKVFVSAELEPVRTGLRSASYNAILWQVDPVDSANDVKLVPVLTLDACTATEGTFYYDHTGGKVYIHPTIEDFSGLEFRHLVIEEGSLFNIENVKSLYMENIEVRFAPEPLYIFKTNECNVTSCIASHTAYGSAFNISATNGNFRNCEAFKACADGFGVGGNGLGIGHMCFYDCHGHHNYDDGVSHHNGSTGAVYGGEWHHNVKGGVAPAHGSVVQMHNVISHDNGYGFYVESDEQVPDALGRKMTMGGCVAYDNNYGISLKNYHLTVYGCKFDDNKHATSVSSNDNTSLTVL